MSLRRFCAKQIPSICKKYDKTKQFITPSFKLKGNTGELVQFSSNNMLSYCMMQPVAMLLTANENIILSWTIFFIN